MYHRLCLRMFHCERVRQAQDANPLVVGVEAKGSHSVYVSKPEEVAALIETAAKGVKLAAR